MPKYGQYYPRLRNSEDCDWAKDREQKGKNEILHCRLGKSAMWYKMPELIVVSLALRDQKYFYSPPGWEASPSQGFPKHSFRQ